MDSHLTIIESVIGILKIVRYLEWKIMAYLKIVQNFGESSMHFYKKNHLHQMSGSGWCVILFATL